MHFQYHQKRMDENYIFEARFIQVFSKYLENKLKTINLYFDGHGLPLKSIKG